MYGTKYATYHAKDWAEGKSRDEIQAEIDRCEHKARTHRYAWNEVGNVSDDWTRIDVLRQILADDTSH